MTENVPVRLLLIEDSPTDVILFRELIGAVEDVHFDVHHRSNLASGLDLLTTEKFDVVVLDLDLPDSAGLATFASVRRTKPEVPLVILTGYGSREVSNQALKQGADNYLLKDNTDGNRIAVAILSAIHNRSRGIHSFRTPPEKPN